MTRISKISVIVLTKNEEAGLGHTLERLQAFEDLIVVDSSSDDRTVEIAEEHGARVVNFTWDGKYPKKKQWALENAGAANHWILLLDADEFPSGALIRELHGLESGLDDGVYAAYDINLLYRFGGRYLRHGHVVTKRSLLDVRRAGFPEVNDLAAPGIREVEGHYQPEADGAIGKLNGRIVHDDRDPVSSWFARHNRYSDWEAHLRMSPDARRDIARRRTAKGRVFDAVPFKPVLFFVYAYVAKAGFLDGRAGLDYATALATYYWQIGVKHRELLRHKDEERDTRQLARFRVIQFVNTLSYADGGPARNSYELNLALNERDDVQADLIWMSTAKIESVAQEELDQAKTRHDRVLGAHKWVGGQLGATKLISMLRASDVVIIHGYYLWWAPFVAIGARLCGSSVLLMPHGSLTAYQQRASLAKKWFFDRTGGCVLRRHVFAFALGSSAEQTDLSAKFPNVRTDVVGVGSRGPSPAEDEREDGAQQTPYVLSLSRLAPKKRIDLTIDAFALLTKDYPDLTLVVAGSGAAQIRKSLRLQVQRLALEEKVSFVGMVSGGEKSRLLSEAEVVVAPSEDENFGIAVAEAIMHGTPVVTTSRVEAAAHLPADVCARLEMVTPDAIADAIRSMLRNDRSAVRAVALDTGKRLFGWEGVANRWMRVVLSSIESV